jgi:two-component system response regulator AtoC
MAAALQTEYMELTNKNDRTILLGEDDSEVRSYLEMALKCQGYAVKVAQDGEEVIASLQESPVHISAILLDIVMPRKDGLETLREIRKLSPSLPVIMVSGASSPLNVVEAMKLGATDFLGKPVTPEDLLRAVRRAFEVTASSRDIDPAGPAPTTRQAYFGTNPKMKEIQLLVGQIGWSEAPVLIQGETGVGKEVLARELHAQSPRAKKPFLKLNCAALPSELVESELFGYERGAFTGAFQRKPGMFEAADGGTLLLDEIGDMDFKLQAKLLQVLQDHEFQRLGGKEAIRVDVRVLAATHCDLEAAIANDGFREDLYYRLNVINFHIPALRDRADEIIPLTKFLIAKHARRGVSPPALTPALEHALMAHHWPGNIRELDNFVRRFLILQNPDVLVKEFQSKAARRASMAQAASGNSNSASQFETAEPVPILEKVTKAKEQAETEAILSVLNATCWNRKQAAVLLNLDYKALLYKMKKLNVEEKLNVVPRKSQGSQVSSGREGVVG